MNLIIVDSHALIHRCYHALPNLTTPKGEPIGAVYGTVRIIFKVIKELKPDYLVACFDLAEPTFRHINYKEYKATRPKTDDSLISQFDKVKQFFDAAKIKHFEMPGFEADDLIGTLVKKFSSEKNLKIIILTGDLDTLQLVDDDKIVIYTMKKGIQDTIIYNENQIKERYGLLPSQIVDFKALKGDPSDNIIGVKGIGEKTAIELIKEFGSLENLYQTIENENFVNNSKSKLIKPKTLQCLIEQKEQAFFSKYLATLDCNVSIEVKLDDLRFKNINKNDLIPLFKEWKFESLLNQLDDSTNNSKQQLINNYSQNNKSINWETQEKINNFSNKEAIISIRDNQIKILVDNHFFQLPQNEQSISQIKNLFLVGYDFKNLIKELKTTDLSLKHDIKIAQWVLNSELKDYSLSRIWQIIFKTSLPNISSLEIIQKIKDRQIKKINELSLQKVFSEIEMPLINILAKMEMNGIKIDPNYFYDLTKKINQEIKNLEEEIFSVSNVKFNINSPKQLSDVLFNQLNIKNGNKRLIKTSTGLFSTRENELIKIKNTHPIIPLILQYRELMKLKTTYLEPLPRLMDKNSRIHTTYNQTGTSTGRLSSENPNLQNIPAKGDWAKKIRGGFVAENGYQFISFDYSQIELRIAAFLSQDQKMIKAFLNNEDIHSLTAAEINNTNIDKITPEMRRQAKTLNFGVLYGMGAKSFSETAQISKDEAKKFIDEYYHDFYSIKDWQEKTISEAKQTGCVKTLTGRLRWVWDLMSGNQKYRSLAEREAINFPIQGLAADIIKIAMIKIDNFLQKEKKENDIRLILQIHDELIFEVKNDLIDWTQKNLTPLMEENEFFNFPLKTQCSFGKTLADLK
ncbi:MAG TPA: DNA polymerase I [Candidatus Paceibacterota bacterium]|nr:DNA polymerase I [Candidatus Paceibacterota bacterium]HPC37303.1 DNA polymerase I [Candidatus Paceibacterota bacterium]HRU35840.1 DNA polymerase I [Candidatus Paceibacterota bacterium]